MTSGNWSLIFWELVMLAVVVVVLLLLAMLVKRLLWNGAANSARRVLDERYARGEIDRDEYERKRRDLGV